MNLRYSVIFLIGIAFVSAGAVHAGDPSFGGSFAYFALMAVGISIGTYAIARGYK